MHTVVETPAFLASAKSAGISDALRADIVSALADRPTSGDLMAGTAGLRKFRFARHGSGKSGGFRVLTYYISEHYPVFLIGAFGKNQKANLTQAEERSGQATESDGRQLQKAENMTKAFDSIMAGLDDVEAYLAGEREGFVTHIPEDVDVKAIRTSLNLSQSRFAETFGFSVGRIRDWEQKRFAVDAPSRVYLTVIQREPDAVLRALSSAQKTAPRTASKRATTRPARRSA